MIATERAALKTFVAEPRALFCFAFVRGWGERNSKTVGEEVEEPLGSP